MPQTDGRRPWGNNLYLGSRALPNDWRYSERGGRYLLPDAGHVCRNLYPAWESIDCGACAVGAFDDDAVNVILDLNSGTSFVIYLASVGKK